MKKSAFKGKVLLILVTTLVIMIGSAFFVNQSIQTIVSQISEEAKPDQRLALLKGIMFDISDAESNVKSYGLTLNEDYLYGYNTSIRHVDSGIVLLNKNVKNDTAFKSGIVRLDTLIKKKFSGLDELLLVQSQQSVDLLLEKVKNMVDEVNDQTAALKPDEIDPENETIPVEEVVTLEENIVEEEVESEVEKEKFFKRIFGNKKKKKKGEDNDEDENSELVEEVPVVTENETSTNNTNEIFNEANTAIEASFDRIDRQIAALKEEESAYEIELKKRELYLIQEDKNIMDEISTIVLELEENEQNRMQLQIEKAEDQRSYTSFVIVIFCLISCCLLAFGGYIIYTYVKRNNAFRKALQNAKEETESKNREIVDSITYAKRIQNAILPDKDFFISLFKQSFVIYKPKDIVAGDFYWVMQTADFDFIAVADCTGHGVPGAMVSITCSAALTRSVKEFGLRKPSDILDKCRELIIESFHSDEYEVYDGMDISLCRFDRNRSSVEFAGARNPLYIIRNNEIITLAADRQSVARNNKAFPFTNNQLDLVKNDHLFLFTDGFMDQFGGSKGKKYMKENFKKLILKNVDLPIYEQGNKMMQSLHDWQGNFDQIDDICVIGLKI